MKPSLLYLDPDGRQLKAFRRLFSGEYDVRASSSAEDALWQLEGCEADIIISDRGAGGGGAEFLRLASRLCPDAFRVMVSAHVTAGALLQEIGEGVVHSFVPKPWDYESMRRALERAEVFARTKQPRRRPTADERRAAPRHTVRLGARVLVMAMGGAGEGEGGTTHAMSAHTYDVSESGVALLIPAQETAALDALGRGYLLRFMLAVPAGAVELTVRPVRREWLGGEEYLVGAEIVDMAGRDRVIYMEYVRGLAGE
jgi:FixJ family two-component response regulator